MSNCPCCGQPMPPGKVRYTPKEATARELARRLGASLNPCRKQIQALLAQDWTISKIQERLFLAEPGEAPWDWTKRARSYVEKAKEEERFYQADFEIPKDKLSGKEWTELLSPYRGREIGA